MNITTVTFAEGTTYVTAKTNLWQWDYGQILRIQGLDLPEAYAVHFSNDPAQGSSSTEIGGSDGVQIPDAYLQTGKPVYAFIFLHTGEDDGETEYKITIYVNARPQPDGETPTPEQQSVIDQLIAALNVGVEESEEAAAAAAQSAQGSAQSASDAAESAQAAAGSATSAESYAGQATTAAGLAQTAQAASEAARNAAQTAQSSAEASATSANGSASSAAGSAAAAAGSASDAGASASAASQAATRAEAAQTAAEDAQEAAEQAAQDAHVEYEQLAGQVTAQGQAITQNTEDIADLDTELTQQKSAIEALDFLVDHKAGMLVDSVSGAIASFVPDATIPDLLGVSVAVEPVQAGSGDPSPDNVRPISGWDAVEIDAAGKNLFDPNGDYSLIPCYNYIGSAQSRRGKILHLPAGTYSLSVIAKQAGTEAYININIINSDGTLALFQSVVNATNLYNRTITITNGQTLAIYDQQATTATSDVKFTQFDFQLEPGSTASAYRPYVGNRYTIQLGQTVYGGTLTIAEDGSVNALVEYKGADLGSLSWSLQQGTPGQFDRFYSTGIAADVSRTATSASCMKDFLCSSLANDVAPVYGRVVDNCICVLAATGGLYAIASQYATAADFKTAMQGQKIVYRLDTPITIQLDPVIIAAISGQTNNVWADAGDVSVEFAADIKTYIDRLNQPTEDDMIANSLIAANKYFTVNNRLFLSTASIAVGAQIIPGTNCTETSLAAALNALNA